jgi:hypothetical protein
MNEEEVKIVAASSIEITARKWQNPRDSLDNHLNPQEALK